MQRTSNTTLIRPVRVPGGGLLDDMPMSTIASATPSTNFVNSTWSHARNRDGRYSRPSHRAHEACGAGTAPHLGHGPRVVRVVHFEAATGTREPVDTHARTHARTRTHSHLHTHANECRASYSVPARGAGGVPHLSLLFRNPDAEQREHQEQLVQVDKPLAVGVKIVKDV